MPLKKIEVKDLGLKFDEIPEAQRGTFERLAGLIVEVVNKANANLISDEEMAAKLQEALKPFSEFNNNSFKSLSDEFNKGIESLKTLGEEVQKLKDRGISTDFISKFDEDFNAMYDSEKFQKFTHDHGPAAKGFVIKDVSLTNNYTGDSRMMLTQQSDIIVTQATDKKDHIRNHVTFLQSDDEATSITYQEVYDVDRNARYMTENGMLPESSFKVREKTAEVKRVGTHFCLSKRMLKNRKFVRSFVLIKVVEAVLNAEDFGLLYGNGEGDNLKGITKYEGVRSVEDIITDNIVTVPAGGVETIEKTEGGVLINLGKPYDLLLDGLKLVITGATNNTSLNGTFDVIKVADTTLLLEGVELSEEGASELKADAEALIIKVRNGLYQSIESPNSIDALNAAVATMSYAEFEPTVLFLNPLTITKIGSEKATDGNRLEVAKDFNGNMKIGPLSVTPNKNVPDGEYVLGDMETGCAIIPYTPLMLEWCDDVETKLKNQVVLYAQEELIFPVMKPHAFSRGKLTALKNALNAG